MGPLNDVLARGIPVEPADDVFGLELAPADAREARRAAASAAGGAQPASIAWRALARGVAAVRGDAVQTDHRRRPLAHGK